MNSKLELLVKRGWQVTIYFQHSDRFFYCQATHETNEIEISSGDRSLNIAFTELYNKAVATTPEWYLHQLKAE